MGDVVLGELIRERGTPPPTGDALDVFLVAVTGADGPEVQRLAHALRDRGVRVEFALRVLAVGKQLGLAAARGAPRAVVIGPDERAAGVAVVRDLRTSAEERVAFDALVDGYGWR